MELVNTFRCGRAQLLLTDCIEWLKQREPLSVQAVVTDPPYGLREYSENEQVKLHAGHGGVWRIPPSFDGAQRRALPRFTVLSPDEEVQLGKQNADEIPCYVFAVKPKLLKQGKRYFEGQIWVDDRDMQIVKTYGKGIGRLKKSEDNQFPKFETLREQVDGKYWFPTYTYADDTLHFRDNNQRIRMIVTYKDYKKFEGRSTIHYGDVVDENKPKEAPKPESKPEPKP